MNRNIETIDRKKDFKGNTMSIKTYLSIITINVNDLNAPIKQHRVADWIKRQDPSICCIRDTHFEPKVTSRLTVRGWRTIPHSKGPQKKAGVAILISEKLDYKPKNVISGVKGYNIRPQGLI